MTHVQGNNQVLPAVENELLAKKVGESKHAFRSLPCRCEKTFGETPQV
jgi:FKBP-type peptidyl-prolyl cis-trans isomerase 2